MEPNREILDFDYTIYYKSILTLPLILLKCWLFKLKMERKKFTVKLMAGEKCIGEIQYKMHLTMKVRRRET